MDLLLVNLVLMGYIERDLSALCEYCEIVSGGDRRRRFPPNYPVVGRDAFRTATGVHAAAVIKAFRKNDRELIDAVYSGVPASLVGREQQIDVGPMSGKSNVRVLARAARHPGDRRARGPDLQQGEGVGHRADRERDPGRDRRRLARFVASILKSVSSAD